MLRRIVETHSCQQKLRLFRRAFRLEHDSSDPVGVNHLNPARTQSTHPGRLPEKLARMDHKGSTVDVPRDQIGSALRGGKLHLFLAQRDRLLYGRRVPIEREICVMCDVRMQLLGEGAPRTHR